MDGIESRIFPVGGADFAVLSFTVQDVQAPGALKDALTACDRIVGLGNVVRQAVFAAADIERRVIEETLAAVYGGEVPVTTYVCQPPAGGQDIAVELWGVPSGAAVRRQDGVSKVEGKGWTWGFFGGLESADDSPAYEGTRQVLEAASARFREAQMAFGRIVRTWYYIGGILEAGGNKDRYAEVNRARNDFYRDMWPDLRESPASTGIGMETRRVAFEAMALEADSNEAAVTWIDNPLQTPPYDYEGQGKPSDNPSFSRAAAVRFADNAVLFVSGTASIRGSEVVCVDDLEAQTRATIENISTLIGTENLARYGFSQGATLENMQQLRVYVKRREGYDVVRSCCEGHFPGVPCTYLVGDVCRPECLVELEGLLETRV